MNRLFHLLFTLAECRFRPQYDARLQFLELQIQMLRRRLNSSRIVPTPEEKCELLQIGKLLGHDVADITHVVQPETYKAWIRQQRKNTRFRRSGRPRIPVALRDLILRIKDENAPWGYRRIQGELRKLGYRIGATTVRNILREAGYPPPPHRGHHPGKVSWNTFVHANIDSIVASDFFTKKVMTLRGTMTAYCLVLIHLGSRKVWCSPSTYHPNTELVMQQNRNAAMWMEDEGIEAKFYLSDRDRKYPNALRQFWRSDGVHTLKTPIQAPKANAFTEAP